MLLTQDTLPGWLRETGEIAYSQAGGVAIRVEVHDSASSLDLLWHRHDRPTIELYAALSGTLDEAQLEATAERVLAINRTAASTGAWLHMAGGIGVSARANVFVVDGVAAAESIDYAIDAIRAVIAKHDGELGRPIDPTHQHPLRARVTQRTADANAEILKILSSAAHNPHAIEARFEGRLLHLSTRDLPPLTARAAARAAGISTISALYRDDTGALQLTTTAILDDDQTRAEQIARTAWDCVAFDCEWLRATGDRL